MKWSYDPYTTFTRGLRLLPLVGLGVLFAQAFSFSRMIRIMVYAFLASAILSTLVSVLVPSLGLDRLGELYAHAWRGAQINKNATGFIYATGIIICFAAYLVEAVDIRVAALTALICIVIVYKAQSTTALVAAIVTFGPALMFWALRNERPGLKVSVLVLFISGAGVVITLVLLNPEIFDLLGKDATFNGRTPIWAAAWTAFTERPWLGHAYSFWAFDYPERNFVWLQSGQREPHAHNTWLDLLVQLGIVGWGIIALLTVLTFARCFREWLFSADLRPIILLSLLIYLVIRSQTEVQFSEPAPGALFWLVWISCSAKAARSRQSTPKSVGEEPKPSPWVGSPVHEVRA